MIVASGLLFIVLQVTMGSEQPHPPGTKGWEAIVGFLFFLTSLVGVFSLVISGMSLLFNKVFRNTSAASKTNSLR